MTDTSLVLATDLDGTLIPLAENLQNQTDLNRLGHLLKQRGIPLIYVTGRHFESVEEAVDAWELPAADWIICDVGTTVYERKSSGAFVQDSAYAKLLKQITGDITRTQLLSVTAAVEGLRLQEEVKQGPFKLSFYVAAGLLQQASGALSELFVRHALPFVVISSVDPFNGDGLIDVLPHGVSKAHALEWWCRQHELSPQNIIFCGDSGNDLAAFTAGYRTVVVGNTARSIADQVREFHQRCGWTSRLICCEQTATSGVLEGLQHFLNQADSNLD